MKTGSTQPTFAWVFEPQPMKHEPLTVAGADMILLPFAVMAAIILARLAIGGRA